jgi:hypothetical protein
MVQKQFSDNRAGDRTRPNTNFTNLLTGLLFDRDDNRFTPTHTVKGGRQYRYYVDRGLITGTGSAQTKHRRIPANEIEEVVRAALVELLNSPNRLLEAVGEEPHHIVVEHVVREAHRLREILIHSTPTTWAEAIRPILHRIVIGESSVTVRVRRIPLRLAMHLPTDSAEHSEDTTYDLTVPTRITMRGVRTKLIIGGNRSYRTPDPALVKALVRAHDWWQRLRADGGTSVRDLAMEEGNSPSYISRVLRLAFLAPDIVEAILDGRQPAELTAKHLILREDLPHSWGDQRRQLGFMIELGLTP